MPLFTLKESILDHNELSPADFKTLFEAVQQWEQAPVSNCVLEMYVSCVLSPSQSPDKVGERMKSGMKDAKEQMSARGEAAILLKAKLIRLRDSMAADAVTRVRRDGV